MLEESVIINVNKDFNSIFHFTASSGKSITEKMDFPKTFFYQCGKRKVIVLKAQFLTIKGE